MQVVFTESLLCEQAWRNPKEGRVGCLHQNIFTWKVTEIAFTSDFCNNYSHPASPTSLYLMSLCPHSHVPASHTWCPQVSRLTSPSPKSPHMRPDVPVPLLYTAKDLNWRGTALQPNREGSTCLSLSMYSVNSLTGMFLDKVLTWRPITSL